MEFHRVINYVSYPDFQSVLDWKEIAERYSIWILLCFSPGGTLIRLTFPMRFVELSCL